MTNQIRPYEPLTSENAALILVDHQVGLMTGVRDYSTGELKHNVVALAKAAKALKLPIIVTTTARDSMWGRPSQSRPPVDADWKPATAPDPRAGCRRGQIGSSKSRLIWSVVLIVCSLKKVLTKPYRTLARVNILSLILSIFICSVISAQTEPPRLLLTPKRLKRLQRDRERQTERWINFEKRVNAVPDSPERGFELALYFAVTHDE